MWLYVHYARSVYFIHLKRKVWNRSNVKGGFWSLYIFEWVNRLYLLENSMSWQLNANQNTKEKTNRAISAQKRSYSHLMWCLCWFRNRRKNNHFWIHTKNQHMKNEKMTKNDFIRQIKIYQPHFLSFWLKYDCNNFYINLHLLTKVWCVGQYHQAGTGKIKNVRTHLVPIGNTTITPVTYSICPKISMWISSGGHRCCGYCILCFVWLFAISERSFDFR